MRARMEILEPALVSRIVDEALSVLQKTGVLVENPHAFAELRALMTAREKLYARAERTVETSGLRVPQIVAAIVG